MKKGMFTLLIIVLMIAFVGCNSAQGTEGQGEESQQSQGKDTLVVGTSADFPPFESHEVVEGKDMIVGFDIDLLNEIAKELDVDIKIEDIDFNGLVAAVQTGKIDMAISGMTPKPDRLEKVDFSDSYFKASQALLVKKGIAKDIDSMDRLKGKIVASQLGTTSDDVISSFEGIEVKKYNRTNDAVLDLNNGRVEAVIIEDTIAKAYVDKNPGIESVIPEDLNEEEEPFAIALPKGEKELLDKINGALKNIKDSGKYDELVEKWFE